MVSHRSEQVIKLDRGLLPEAGLEADIYGRSHHGGRVKTTRATVAETCFFEISRRASSGYNLFTILTDRVGRADWHHARVGLAGCA